MTGILSEAFRAADETIVAVPKSYPPPADPRAETHRYLPAVPEFFGQRCVHPATLPLPATSQHAATLAYEALERTLDLGPQSGVRTTAPSAGGAAPAPRITGTGEVAGGARGHGVPSGAP